MGQQQILLIVIGVIIVGIMVVVGISIFNLNEYNSNKRNLAAELSTYPPFVFKYWETVEMLGGAGGNTDNVTPARVAGYIGFTGPNNSWTSENGEFRVIVAAGTRVSIRGLGSSTRNGKHPMVTARINLATKTFTTTVTDNEGW